MATSLRRSDWLPLAKTLRVGESRKVVHPDDRGARPSLTVTNHPDRYAAWCFRRNMGGVVFKDAVFHVPAPKESADLALPGDMVPISELEYHERQAVGRFLLSKGVSDRYLPDLFYSESRQRLLIEVERGAFFGRDLTETHPTKWVQYKYLPHLAGVIKGTVVLVEDPLSYYKLCYALAGTQYSPVALLGTRIRPKTLQAVVNRAVGAVVMLDGDAAGRRATPKVVRDLRGFGLPTTFIDTPEGKDPKDLTLQELRDVLQIV